MNVSIALFASIVTLDAAVEWPDFRGPTGDGHVAAKGLPTEWSETNNVKWKAEIPYHGISTPIILDGQGDAVLATGQSDEALFDDVGEQARRDVGVVGHGEIS